MFDDDVHREIVAGIASIDAGLSAVVGTFGMLTDDIHEVLGKAYRNYASISRKFRLAMDDDDETAQSLAKSLAESYAVIAVLNNAIDSIKQTMPDIVEVCNVLSMRYCGNCEKVIPNYATNCHEC